MATIEAWIKNVGDPMKAEVEAHKKALWLVVGGAGVVGAVIGLLAPIVHAWLKSRGMI